MRIGPLQFWYSVRDSWWNFRTFFRRSEYVIGIVAGALVALALAIRALFH